LRLGCGRLGAVFFQQRLEGNETEERQSQDEEETALGPGFLLRIFEFGQSFT
jgi:hypothetical protein